MVDSGVTIDQDLIKRLVEQAVETNINKLVDQLCADPGWTARVETMINQTVVYETIKKIGSIDINPTIKGRVDENMKLFTDSLLSSFTSTGIKDIATECQLTVSDDAVVIGNSLETNNLHVFDTAHVRNLILTGSINTDNLSWQSLVNEISQKTLDLLTSEWNKNLIRDVVDHIREKGIDFAEVSVGGQRIIEGDRLTGVITESSLQSVGTLKTLQVRGETHINNNTVNILNKRLGVNTETPEMALSVWDEEVSVVIGKNRANEAYIGTNRDQGVTIGVNREPQIELDTSGLTRIKQLQVGLHKVSHAIQVPGWAGTKGDIVFNANPSVENNVFAWVCLGAHRWKTIKSVE